MTGISCLPLTGGIHPNRKEKSLNALLNLLIGAALMAGIYLAMIAGGAAHDLAASTAILVGATGGLQTLRSDALATRLAQSRQRCFERRLDIAHDRVIAIVHARIEDILPGKDDVK